MRSHILGFVSALVLVFSLFPAAMAHDGDNEVEFTGTVTKLPASGFVGDWTVGGRTVHVTAATRIDQEDGHIMSGSTVKVEGAQRADGSVDATEIESQEAGGDDHGGGDDGGGSGGSGGSGGGSGGGGGDHSGTTFKGTIESFPAGFVGDWHVGGRVIHVTAATRIEASEGPVAVGALVEIEGTVRADLSIDATKIEVQSNPAGDDGRDELTGTIQHLPATADLTGDWTVSGHTVHVTAATRIDREHGSPAVGATVEVKGTMRADGSIDATTIEVKSSAGDDSGEGQAVAVKGMIQTVPADIIGDWTVAGQTIHVVSSTKLNREHGAFVVGARVKVKGMQMSDGTVVATKIQLRDSE